MERSRRTKMRLVKLGLVIAGVGFLGEGLFEIGRLSAVLTAPPSVPGESKIVEHFALQHLAFPVLCLLLAMRPAWLSGLVDSRACRWSLALLALVLVVPEVSVSFGGPGGGDLFRPYPFDLQVGLLRALQTLELGDRSINVLQLQHLFFNHVLLTAVLLALALRPSSLGAFFGPHTGGGAPAA
jgi:hypothetical protein